MSTLKDRNPKLYKAVRDIPIHMLGLLDGPNEISLIRTLKDRYDIVSWDSSAAVWYAINSTKFDDSPTGSVGGKLELEVNFDYPFVTFQVSGEGESVTDLAKYNMSYIDRLCGHQG